MAEDKSIQKKFTTALSELIGMCMDGGMHTSEMVPIVDKELEQLKRPFQNEEDNGG